MVLKEIICFHVLIWHWSLLVNALLKCYFFFTWSWQGTAHKDISSWLCSINSFALVQFNGVMGLKGITLVSSTTATAWRDGAWGSLMRVSDLGWSWVAAVNWSSAAVVGGSATTHSGMPWSDLGSIVIKAVSTFSDPDSAESRPVSATSALVSISEEKSPLSRACKKLRFYWKWPTFLKTWQKWKVKDSVFLNCKIDSNDTNTNLPYLLIVALFQWRPYSAHVKREVSPLGPNTWSV